MIGEYSGQKCLFMPQPRNVFRGIFFSSSYRVKIDKMKPYFSVEHQNFSTFNSKMMKMTEKCKFLKKFV